MTFFQYYESSSFKTSTKKWDSSTSTKKKEKSHLLQPLLDFLTPIEEFFYPPSLVFYLKSFILIQNPTLKPLSPR
jgi:hypothetical protein